MQRREAGFTFIEILVVMGIIVVLMGMVAVVVPRAQEASRKTQSVNNVKQIATILNERSIKHGWPRYSGKAFVLSLVADGVIDPSEEKNLEIFFSPGDAIYELDDQAQARFPEVTTQALASGGEFRELTSYAGRRNSKDDREYVITPTKLKKTVPILCDDDDGPCHHPDGLVVAYTDGTARFQEWNELGMPKPDDTDNPDLFLGENAADDAGKLAGLSSD